MSLLVAWIFLAAMASIYLPRLYSLTLARVYFVIFILMGVAILGSYFLGIFGGREYFEYPPIFALTIAHSWVLFLANFIKSYATVNFYTHGITVAHAMGTTLGIKAFDDFGVFYRRGGALEKAVSAGFLSHPVFLTFVCRL
ncbi:MAG: hypothetical protein ACUVRD_03375 [Bacteroidia bacterium]